MSRRNSVFNKRSNERVQNAQSGGGGFKVSLPQAHAQQQNPTRNQTPQARTQSTRNDPWARAAQFATNVGRGAADTGKSYTTDLYDMAESTVTGREREERSYEDETLAGVFGRGLFEGNLEGSFDEAGRRIKEEPGRVVGEVAAEAAIMAATMGFGAVAKGARIGLGATSKIPKITKNTKSIRGATQEDGAVGFTRKTGFIRKGTEEKYIGNKRTTVITKNRKGVEKRRVKKTNILDRLERFGTKHGERFGNKLSRPTRLANPMVIGASGKVPPTDDEIMGVYKLADQAEEMKTPAQRRDGMEKLIKEMNDAPTGSGGNTGTGGVGSEFTKETVNLDMSYPIKLGDNTDTSYIGSMKAAEPFSASQRVDKNSIFWAKRDGVMNDMNPNFGDTVVKENKIPEYFGNDPTRKPITATQEAIDNRSLGLDQEARKYKSVDEWVKAYSDDIEANKNIKGDSEIQRSLQETGVLGKFSTDETVRTNPSSFIEDKSAAIRQAEIIIRDGFNTGKPGSAIESSLTDIIGGYGTPAVPVKTNIRTVASKEGKIISGDGYYNPENVGIGTEVGSFASTKSNKVKSILPSMVSDSFKEADATLYPANMGQIESVGKISTYGGRPSKTGMERYWEMLKEAGDGTSIEKTLTGEDVIKPGTSVHKQDPTDYLVSTQHDFVRTNKQGNLIGNPQLGLSQEQNTIKMTSALDNILGPVAKTTTVWTKKGERSSHLGYAAFRKKYNAGKLKSQNNVVPTKKLPAKLSTFKSQRNLTDKMYNDLLFQQNKKGTVTSSLKKYVDGDVMEEEYTGEIGPDSLFTKQGFKDAGSVEPLYNSQELPYSNLGRELQISARTRTSTITKPVVKRSSTPWSPKTTIEKDANLVSFDINRIHSLDVKPTTKLAQKKSGWTRRLTGDNRGPKGGGKTGVYNNKGKKKKPQKYTTFTSLFAKTTDSNSMATNIDTGMPDPMARNTPQRVPLWATGGGDTTRIGGGKIYPPSGIRKLDPKPRKAVFPNPSSMMFGYISKNKSESEMINFSRKTRGLLGGGAKRNDWFMQP